MHELILTAADANRRLDKFLSQYLNNAPRSFLYKMMRKKRIKLNGKRAEGHEITSAGDCITFYLSPETMQSFMSERTVAVSSFAPDIIYEDDFMLLLNKPAGLLTHEAAQETDDTLLRRVLYYLQQTGAYDDSRYATFTPALCNRLDRNTSGLVVCGKTLAALQSLNHLFASRDFKKEYLAVVHGTLSGIGTLEGYYQKDELSNTAHITVDPQGGVVATTKYEAVSLTKEYTLLRVEPVTGRSHQIRAHLAGIGHPLAGDVKYGGKKTPYAPAQLLHCRSLSFIQTHGLPYKAECLWHAPLPEGFAACLHEIFHRGDNDPYESDYTTSRVRNPYVSADA